MYASIQSLVFPKFFCRIFSKPVIENANLAVYKLAGHGAQIDTSLKGKNDIIVDSFDHIAIVEDGIVYLFDMSKRVCGARVGTCSFIPDGSNGPGSN